MRESNFIPRCFSATPISLYLIISRANCHVPGKRLRPTTSRHRLLNLRPLIPRAEYRRQTSAKGPAKKRKNGARVPRSKRESADTHDLIMFIVGGSGNHARGRSSGICIMRNYTCANSARNTVRIHARTHTRTWIPGDYNDRRLFIPPLNSLLTHPAWITSRIR